MRWTRVLLSGEEHEAGFTVYEVGRRRSTAARGCEEHGSSRGARSLSLSLSLFWLIDGSAAGRLAADVGDLCIYVYVCLYVVKCLLCGLWIAVLELM